MNNEIIAVVVLRLQVHSKNKYFYSCNYNWIIMKR